MANRLLFGRKFERLVNYQEWTDSITSDVAHIVDSANIAQIDSELRRIFQSIDVPQDYRNWVSSDVLHIRHTMDNVHDAVCALGLSALFAKVDLWHERVIGSLRAQWSSPILCCGPGPVEDIVLPADEFVQQFMTDELKITAATRNPVDVAKDEADVVAFLWQAARQPGKGLKPFVDDRQLRQKLANVFDFFDSPPKSQLPGGAQTIMASACRQIGIEADVTWPYQSEQVAKFGHREPFSLVRRVVIRNGSHIEHSPLFSSDPRRPHRRSHILNITDGMDIAGIQATGNDRVIFRVRRYHMNDWDLHEVILKCSNGCTVLQPSSWQLSEWPSLPLIGSVEAGPRGGKNRMIFSAPDDRVLRSLARIYRRFIWTGLQTLDDPGFDQKTRQILVNEVAHQFEVLSSEGARIYVEISGVPRSPGAIKEIIGGKPACVGINQTELAQLTSRGTKETNPVWAWPNPARRPESLLERYQRGICLARYMKTDLFIHGNECSLYITRSQSRARMEEIVSAILAAKLAVVSHLLDRAGVTPHIEQPSLAEKGFMALIQFAFDFARSYEDQDMLNQLVNDGYYCTRNDSEVSVVIVPVLWPQEMQQISPAGAGDTIAGVVAALLPS